MLCLPIGGPEARWLDDRRGRGRFLSETEALRQAVEASCMGYLARREHSQLELTQKLSRKGFPMDIVSLVIADLSERGLQSDSRYAEIYVRSRLSRGYGPVRIRQELRQRGIDPRLLADLQPADADDNLQKTHDRKFGAFPPENLEERAERERFLLRRGFSGDQIRRFFRDLRNGDIDD
jgi:regulatory protein